MGLSKFKLKHFVVLLLTVFAIMEFYTLSYGLNTVALIAGCGLAIILAFIFPKESLVDRVNFPVIIFLLSLCAYSLLSYYWAIDKNEALEYSTLMLRNTATFIIFSAMFRSRKVCRNAQWFFFAIVIAYQATAVWEITTWQHLWVSRYYGIETFIPTGPFYGENNMAAFMLLILPYALFIPWLHNRWWIKLVCGLIVLAGLVIITIQGARIALLAGFVLTAWVMLKYTNWKSKLISTIIVGVLLLGLLHIARPYVSIVWSIFDREISSIGMESNSNRMSSVKIRQQLVKESLDLTANSGFMGVGAGNFERYMSTDIVYRTAGIINPHNYFLELMGNYGVGFLLWFLALYLGWARGLYMASKAGDYNKKGFYLMHLFALLMFVPASALPSSIKWNHLIWIMFAMFNRISHPDFWREQANCE